MRIITLVARHGTTSYATALEDLDDFYARRLPAITRDTIVSDSALPEDFRGRLSANCVLIGGSNSEWEFSALDSAIHFLGKRILKFDFVHIVTSAFRQSYTTYLGRFDPSAMIAMRGRAAAIGHIDRYNSPVVSFGRETQSWLRSSFIFVPPVELLMLRTLVSVRDPKILFSGNPAEPFRGDAPIDESYRQNILGWLTGSGTGQGTAWHSRFALTMESLPRFEAKTLAILNEQALAIRLRAQGCATVDATWLATCIARNGADAVAKAPIPHWRHQLEDRDVDPVVFGDV